MDMNYIHTEVLKLNKVPKKLSSRENRKVFNNDQSRHRTTTSKTIKLMTDGEHGPLPKQMGMNPEALEG